MQLLHMSQTALLLEISWWVGHVLTRQGQNYGGIKTVGDFHQSHCSHAQRVGLQ